MSRLTRDGTAETVSRDQISGTNADREIFIFPVQLTRLIHTLAICVTIRIVLIPQSPYTCFHKYISLLLYRCGHHLRNSYFARGSRLIGTPKPSTCFYRQVLISTRHLPLELWRSYPYFDSEPCTHVYCTSRQGPFLFSLWVCIQYY